MDDTTANFLNENLVRIAVALEKIAENMKPVELPTPEEIREANKKAVLTKGGNSYCTTCGNTGKILGFPVDQYCLCEAGSKLHHQIVQGTKSYLVDGHDKQERNHETKFKVGDVVMFKTSPAKNEPACAPGEIGIVKETFYEMYFEDSAMVQISTGRQILVYIDRLHLLSTTEEMRPEPEPFIKTARLRTDAWNKYMKGQTDNPTYIYMTEGGKLPQGIYKELADGTFPPIQNSRISHIGTKTTVKAGLRRYSSTSCSIIRRAPDEKGLQILHRPAS